MSNSAASRCFQYCKDTNFKANHNTLYNKNGTASDVSNIAKILILKQITTALPDLLFFDAMFPILQRY